MQRNIVAFLSVVVNNALVVASTLNYLGAGYDIYRGDPLHPLCNVDPGFRQAITTSTYQCSVPDPLTSCSLQFGTEVIQSMSSYKDYVLNSSIRVFLQGQTPFAASPTYANINKSFNQSNVLLITQANCIVLEGSLPYGKQNVSLEFSQDVANLPECSIDEQRNEANVDIQYTGYDANVYMSFIEKYGTHYTSVVELGRRIGIMQEIRQANWANQQNQVNVAEETIYSLSASYANVTNRRAFQNTVDQQELLSRIEDYPEGDNIDIWLMHAVQQSFPIGFQLEDIDSLLTMQNFPENSFIVCQRANLQRALNDYCQYLQGKGILASCDEDITFIRGGY